MSDRIYTDEEKIKRLTAWHEADKQEIDALRSEIANYETARQEDARRLEQVKGGRDAITLLLWDISKCVEPDEDNIFLPVSSEIAKHIFYKVAAALKDAK